MLGELGQSLGTGAVGIGFPHVHRTVLLAYIGNLILAHPHGTLVLAVEVGDFGEFLAIFYPDVGCAA